jgi:predicted nucleic acid-binding protein
MRDPQRVYVFDTVALSNFAIAGRLDLLAARYGQQLLITQEVLDEVADGVVAGYFALRTIEEAFADETFGKVRVLSSRSERNTYGVLLRILGSGEASCIAYAESQGGIVVTDDRAARGCCLARGIACTGTIGILKACCQDDLLPPEEADAILTTMIEAGYYAPVQRISDLL